MLLLDCLTKWLPSTDEVCLSNVVSKRKWALTVREWFHSTIVLPTRKRDKVGRLLKENPSRTRECPLDYFEISV